MRRRAKLNNKRQVKEGDGLRRRLYVSYCPRSNSKLTQYPSGVRKPQQNQYEISGLILPSREITENRDSRIHGRSLPSINEKEEKGWCFKARCKKAP
jgi:hypothetical protein